MSHAEILEGVRRVLERRLAVRREVSPATRLVADLELDSMQELALVVELENHFAVCFEPGDELAVVTVGDLVGLLARRLEQAS